MSTRKTWTEKEDEALKRLIEEQHMTKWAEIAHVMADRFGFSCNEKQCRGRYLHKLAKTVNSSPLSAEEEETLFGMQAELGNRWAAIAAHLHRTDNFVKNHFYAKLRRCMRKVNKLLAKFASRLFHRVETATLYKIIQTVHHNPLSRTIRDHLRKFEEEHYESKDLDERIHFAKLVAEQIANFEPKIRKNTELAEDEREREDGDVEMVESESYHSSNPSSHHNSVNSYHTSSKSNSHSCNSHSHSHSNSHSNSSVSFKPPYKPSTPQFLPMPIRIKRSHSIDSDSDCIEEVNSLYRSANLENRSKLKPKMEMEAEAECQDYLTSSANLDMFDEIIKIRFISPKVSPESSSKHSSDQIEVEAEANLMDNPFLAGFPKESDRKQDLLQEILANHRQMKDLD